MHRALFPSLSDATLVARAAGALAPRPPRAVVARRSPIHGHGLFAARAFAPGERVAEYRGERVTKAESVRRQRARDGAAPVFLLELDEHHDLDGGGPDNAARWMNHSCAPTCEAVVENGRVWLQTRGAVAAGAELTFDYGFPLAVFPGHPCRCGAAGCAGFIVSRPERWRARRLLGQAGRSLVAAREGRS